MLVDDELSLLDLSKKYLESVHSLDVQVATSAEEAVERLKRQAFDAIVSDYQMPGMNGIDFLRLLRSKKVRTPFILFTGKGQEEIAIEALRYGASFYLQKGNDPRIVFIELSNLIRVSVKMREAELALARGSDYFWSVVRQATDCIMILDRNATVLYCNPATLRVCGLPEGRVMGQSALKLVHSEDARRLAELISGCALNTDLARPVDLRARSLRGYKRLCGTALSPDGETLVMSLCEPSRPMARPKEATKVKSRRLGGEDLSREITFRLISRLVVDRMNVSEGAISRNRFLPAEISAKRTWEKAEAESIGYDRTEGQNGLSEEVMGRLIDTLAGTLDFEAVDEKARKVEEANRRFYGPG